MATSSQQQLPPVPNNQPVLDQQGMISLPWSLFFTQLYLRVGGSSSATLAQIEAQISSITESAPNTIKGNNTGSPSFALDLTPAQIAAMLPVFTNSAKGLVPPSGGGTLKFLRADGTFQVPLGEQDFFMSSLVNTLSTAITSSSFATFSNSPGFVFTPTYSGKYKVYASIPGRVDGSLSAKGAIRVFNTAGTASLVSESQAYLGGVTSTVPVLASVYAQSVYTLTAGLSATFDIQGLIASGTSIQNDGTDAQFYLFAEKVG